MSTRRSEKTIDNQPYARFSDEECILRDYLAMDRTILASERTFLAYIRTALTLIVAGVTLVKLCPEAFFQVLGWAFIPLGLGVAVWGLIRHKSMRAAIRSRSGK